MNIEGNVMLSGYGEEIEIYGMIDGRLRSVKTGVLPYAFVDEEYGL